MNPAPLRRIRPHLGTYVEIEASDAGDGAAAAAVDAAFARIAAIEAAMSFHHPGSELSRLNRDAHRAPQPVGPDTRRVLEHALTLARLSDGAFDPCIAPRLVAGRLLPPPDGATPPTGGCWQDIHLLDDGRVGFGRPLWLDLGGIAKGYAADLLRAQLEKEGVTSATLDLGGDVFVMGRKTDGSDWRIAVKDPADTESYLGVVSAADKFIVTSGVYERYFEENGVRYHHILDPKTGCPAESGLVSVTVLCENGAWADALSTACFVLGPDGALALRDDLADQGTDFELILVTDDGRVLYTDGLADAFTPNDESGYTYEALA